MSTDVLRRHVHRHIDYIRQLQSRGLPLITCAFVRIEGEPPGRDYQPRYSPLAPGTWYAETVMRDSLFHPSNRVSDPFRITSHTSSLGGNHVHLFYPLPLDGDPLAEWLRQVPNPNPGLLPDQKTPADDALSLVSQVCEMLAPLADSLPSHLSERLGFSQTGRSYSWVEVLFHLGWHFPDHGIEAVRCRILSRTDEAPWESVCPELQLQLGGVRASPDVFPGVIVSRLGPMSDFLTASVNALLLILEALDGIECGAQPQPHPDFGRLRDEFRHLGETFSQFPRELTARVLRLADNPKDCEEELRKKITTFLLYGDRIALFDNLTGAFGDGTLDRALTGTEWQDRILGANRQFRGPLTVTFYGTGNNVVIRADTARRICHIRLESPHERPEERADVKRPHLINWVTENRERLLAKALTILSAYHQASRPDFKLKPWGSFESWSALVRNAVVWCGLVDPGETRVAVQDQADETARGLRQLITALEMIDPDQTGKTAAEIVAAATVEDAACSPEVREMLRDAVDSLVSKADARNDNTAGFVGRFDPTRVHRPCGRRVDLRDPWLRVNNQRSASHP